MQLTPELKLFIREHASDDTDRLLLGASRFPDINVPFAVIQIHARRQVRNKLPSWYNNEDIVYPSSLAAEQCSSEQTGLYKQGLLRGDSFCDLTGGLGVDTFFFAQKAISAIYVERFPEYCEAARTNFEALKATNIRINNADAREVAGTCVADTFYIDPARRAECNKRAFALEDCEPDILQLKPLLLDRAQRVIVKISPMADIEETLRLLPETREVHILSVKNECKELLFVLENQLFPAQPTRICAVDLSPDNKAAGFSFYLQEEKEAELSLADKVGSFLYEPHAALLKSGAFKLIAIRYGLKKLHRHSHLYTSEQFCPDFPGRSFEVDETIVFSGKMLKQIGKQIPKANLTTRNFPLSVMELRKRSQIKEGGDIYLFATTLCNENKVFLKVHKV